MSRVFVAEETSLGRKVVVKVLPSDLAATVNVERFRREIQLAAKLQHPHIVPVLAAGISDGLPYYTMPFIEGESLRARLARSGELPVQEAARILRDVLSALSYAHEHGVVHRDIKPDNVLLTGNHAVVADFGVAKALSASTNPGSSLTSLGVALGTPAYMSPEQAAADPTTDHRSDLYGVGAMAYEMLTGQQVFSARSPQAMLAAHATEKPEPIDKRRPSVPPALSSLIMRSLEKHAADRPQSAGEMLAELEAAVTPSGATTPHVSAITPRASDRGQRGGVLMAVGAAVVLLTLTSSSWYWYDHKTLVAPTTPTDATPSLAVLPFENLGKSDDAYFADGMTEEISSRLGKVPGLRLIGRQSAKGYANTTKPVAQIGKELGVAYLLTGTVRWDRSRVGRNLVKVSPALLRASDGVQIWSEPYQDEVTGVFEIQGNVAERVAQALKLRLTEAQQKTLSSQPTNNVEAYDYYLRANALGWGTWNPSEFSHAIDLYQRAIALDSGFTAAYAALGRAHLSFYWFRGDPTPRRLELAKGAIDKALALQPTLSAAHVALADYYYHGKLDYAHALDAIAVAQRLSPKDPEAMAMKAFVERRQSRWTESISDMSRALEIDPRNEEFLETQCETLTDTRNYEAAQETCSHLNAIKPDHWPAYFYLSTIAILRSASVKDALSVLETAEKQIGAARVGAALMDEETRGIWPAIVNRDLSRNLAAGAEPSEDAKRLGYFASKLLLAGYQRNTALMHQFADSIALYAPRAIRGTFFDSEVHANLSLAYAAVGDKGRAVEEGRRAMSIVPIQVDGIRGAVNLEMIARAETLVAADDQAIAALRQLLTVPSGLSPAWLRVDPWYDRLRRDPRFKELVSTP
jgi:eukaryotic-like serine/threonine-protein kinase